MYPLADIVSLCHLRWQRLCWWVFQQCEKGEDSAGWIIQHFGLGAEWYKKACVITIQHEKWKKRRQKWARMRSSSTKCTPTYKPALSLHPVAVKLGVWQQIGIDLVGPLPETPRYVPEFLYALFLDPTLQTFGNEGTSTQMFWGRRYETLPQAWVVLWQL